MAATAIQDLDITGNDSFEVFASKVKNNLTYLRTQGSDQTLLYPIGNSMKCDGIKLTDVTATSGGTVTSATYQFTTNDVGKLISVVGAGASGAVLNSSIQSVSLGAATLVTNPSTTVTSTGVATFGTDDTVAFQALVNKAAAVIHLNGAAIQLPAGITVVSTVTWASNVSLFGQGAGKSILKHIMTTDATTAMLINTSGNLMADCQFRDFGMDMSAATSAGGYQVLASCIRINVTKRCVVDGCYFTGSPATCLAFDYAIECSITHNYIENYGLSAIVSSQGGAGIGCALSSTNVQSYCVSDNVLVGAALACATYGIFFETQSSSAIEANISVSDNVLVGTGLLGGIADCGARRMTITGNHVTSTTNNTGHGIVVQGGTTGYVAGEQGLIANNTITSTATGSGIAINYTAGEQSGQICGYLITGNRIQGAGGHGVKITANASTVLSGLSILGNFIEGCAFAGVILVGAGGFSDITISGNTIINNGTGGSGITTCGIAIEAATARLTMVGNDIYDNATGTQKYAFGVNTSIAVTSAWIVGNNFANNATGAIDLISGATIAGTIAMNNGYNPVGASSVTTSGSPYTYTAGNSPGTLYMSASTITALTQNGNSILSESITTAMITVPFNANDTIVVTYTGTLTAKQMIN